MKKKICFISLGCSRNLVDTETMLGLALKDDFIYEVDLKNADFIILNTCGFLEIARKESLDNLKYIFENKKKNSKVIVAGCMAELFFSEFMNLYPDIFGVIGPGNIEDIIEVLHGKNFQKIITKKNYLAKKDTPRIISTPQNYAYLKISEGCLKNCSYCLIPKIKGKLKSKKIEEVLLEFKNLLENGVREIILIAQDLGDYGKDFKEKMYLEKLLKKLIAIKGDFKIRLLYLYPDSLSEELIHIIKDSNGKIIKYLDLPLQHINTEILQKMKRNTSKEKIESLIKKIRKIIPDIVIRSTFIVGFPGEEEKQFLELEEFLKEFKIDYAGFFKFSREKNTLAYDLQNQIDENIKEKRMNKLYKLQNAITKEKNKKYIGKTFEIYIEAKHPESEDLLIGRLDSQAPEVDPIVIINKYEKFDGFYKRYQVKITKSVGLDLLGEII